MARILFFRNLNIFYLFLYFAVSTIQAGQDVELDIHAVGQGNCITLKVPRPQPVNGENYEYMIVDLGSSSYNSEKAIKKIWIDKTQEALAHDITAKLQKASLSPNTPTSDVKPTVQPRTVNKAKEDSIKPKLTHKLIRWLYGEEIKENLQDFLKEIGKKSNKVIKSVVITHPDADHNNLLYFLKNSEIGEKIIIENLILGGLPKRYEKLTDTLDELLKTADCSRIYFPATGQYYSEGMDLTKSVELAPDYCNLSPQQQQVKEDNIKLKAGILEILKAQNPDLYSEALKFFEDKPSTLQKKTTFAFQKAFNFENNNFKIFCLCANALHIEGKSGKGLRIADDAPAFSLVQDLEEPESKREHLYRTYNNADSIILKLEYFGKSAILTGDATQIVTDRIADNYANNPDFLKSDILIAGHHGSSSHGSNNPTWIGQVQPRYVLISNGTMYGHPDMESYEAFKASPRIEKRLDPHYVLVTRSGPRKSRNKTYDARLTYKGIYSTLSNGNLKVIFPGEHPQLEQDKIENLVVQRLQKEQLKKLASREKAKSKPSIFKSPSHKTKPVIKGIKISLYKDSEKMVEKDDKEYSSDEENTDIIPQIEESDIVPAPLQFENPKEEI